MTAFASLKGTAEEYQFDIINLWLNGGGPVMESDYDITPTAANRIRLEVMRRFPAPQPEQPS